MRGTSKKANEVAQRVRHEGSYQMASLRYAPEMAEVLWEVQSAFEAGMWPEPCVHGTSQPFFLKDSHGEPIAIFKLEDYQKEYAAYRLDHGRFAGVPPTVITTLTHPVWGGAKTGSCQLFVEGSMGLHYSFRGHESLSADSIRRVALLDLRVLNGDRHTSNILVQNGIDIVPIDHGFIFPSNISGAQLTWIHWEQSHTPFSDEEKQYVQALDPYQDRNLLFHELDIPERLANRLYVATVLLKQGVASGLTCYQLGSIVLLRDKEAYESRFATMVEAIRAEAAEDWETFVEIVQSHVEDLVDEVSQCQYK